MKKGAKRDIIRKTKVLEKKMRKSFVKSLCIGAIIAALYTALTLIAAPLSFGPVQIRISEALTVLPAVCPAATAGLTLGCFISNIIGFIMGANPLGVIDAFVGSAATLLAALCTAYIGRKVRGGALYALAPLPPVVFNALLIGAELTFIVSGKPDFMVFIISAAYIALGQAIACYLGGNLLLKGSRGYFEKYLGK